MSKINLRKNNFPHELEFRPVDGMGLSHGWKAVEGGRRELVPSPSSSRSAVPGETRALHSHGLWLETPEFPVLPLEWRKQWLSTDHVRPSHCGAAGATEMQ